MGESVKKCPFCGISMIYIEGQKRHISILGPFGKLVRIGDWEHYKYFECPECRNVVK